MDFGIEHTQTAEIRAGLKERFIQSPSQPHLKLWEMLALLFCSCIWPRQLLSPANETVSSR